MIYKVDYFDPNMYDIHGKGANCLIFSSKTLLDPINGTTLAGVKLHGMGANCLIISSKTLLDPRNGTTLAGLKRLNEI